MIATPGHTEQRATCAPAAVLRRAPPAALSQFNIITNSRPKRRAKSIIEIKRLSNGNYDIPEQFEITPLKRNLEKTGAEFNGAGLNRWQADAVRAERLGSRSPL